MADGPHLSRFDHISDALACLHWLRVPERFEFKIAVLTYKVIHGLAPGYLGLFTRVAYLPSRQSLRSVDTNRLIVPTSRLSTVGSRAFPIAGPLLTWNDLRLPRKTWHQQNHSIHFVVSLRHICSWSLFHLLDINWLSPVELAVVPLLRPPKIIWLIDLIVGGRLRQEVIDKWISLYHSANETNAPYWNIRLYKYKLLLLLNQD